MITLRNGLLEADIEDNDAYRGTRFDHTLLISQVRFKGHSFLGIERTPAGTGTGGKGLYSGWLWRKRIRHGGAYPMPGIGWLDIPEGAEYSIRENYPYRPAAFSMPRITESEITAESHMAGFCHVMRHVCLEGSSLTIVTTLSNCSNDLFDIEEYCHSFLQFDNHIIDSTYSVMFQAMPAIRMVRGCIKLSGKGYSPMDFDSRLGTIAFSIDEEIQDMAEIRRDSCSVSIIDNPRPLRGYHWISEAALCPESYQSLILRPGESGTFSRTFTFHAE